MLTVIAVSWDDPGALDAARRLASAVDLAPVQAFLKAIIPDK